MPRLCNMPTPRACCTANIKPSNLLLDMQGTVWVTDFGLAKLDDDRGLTETGDVLGTLRDTAPRLSRATPTPAAKSTASA